MILKVPSNSNSIPRFYGKAVLLVNFKRGFIALGFKYVLENKIMAVQTLRKQTFKSLNDSLSLMHDLKSQC